MDNGKLKKILDAVKAGDIPVEAAMEKLRGLPYEDLGYAKLDLHRAIRTGFPEVVFCQGKTAEQCVGIIGRLALHHAKVLATRVTPEIARQIASAVEGCTYHELARLLVVERPLKRPTRKTAEPATHPDKGKYIMVLCAGTADLPVAEEAAVTAETLGSRVERAYDVGVAGLHRLLDQREKILRANVLIVAAGMEGALPSVVGGMVSCPVIAVPTSVGYGASFGGLAALLAMLNACATGIAVMNIDNGFGAGYFAHLVNR
jgi:NCAIR mutase (PurE)-related protein